MAIDTGDLVDKTYKAIMVKAERFNHDLTLQFTLLSLFFAGRNLPASAHCFEEETFR
jgi:hypothetical protein